MSSLDRNETYTYYVESATDDEKTAASQPRSFYVDNGIMFSQRVYTYTVNRDYNQQPSPAIQVTNTDNEGHTLLCEIINPYEDLVVGFTGDGSVDAIIPVNASSTRNVNLVVHAQDAEKPEGEYYEVIARITNDTGTDQVMTDEARLRITVHWPNIDFSFEEVETDPATLTKRFRITNQGDALTDLRVTADENLAGFVIFEPVVEHAGLASGRTLEFKAIPSLKYLFEHPSAPRSGVLTVSAGTGTLTQNQEITVDFSPPAGKDFYAVMLNDVFLASRTRVDNCTNHSPLHAGFQIPAEVEKDKITQACLAAVFGSSSGVYPHNIRIYVNNNLVGELSNTVPRGDYTFDLPTSALNIPTVGVANNSIRLDSTMNRGSYLLLEEFITRISLSEVTFYVIAADQAGADQLAAGNSYFKSESIVIEQPADNQELFIGTSTTIQVKSAAGVSDLSVRASFSNGDPAFSLIHQGSGLYTGRWTPTNLADGGCTITLSYEVCDDGKETECLVRLQQPAVDITPPVVTITSPNNGRDTSTTSDVMTISGTATDTASGVATVFINTGQDNAGNPDTFSFSVPLSEGANEFVVTAADNAGNTGTDTITITYQIIEPPLTITTPSLLPDGQIDSFYSQTLSVTGGTSPYTWTKISGDLPDGLSLSPSGFISGTPAAVGDFTFTVKVTDSSAPVKEAAESFSITVPNIIINLTQIDPAKFPTIECYVSVTDANYVPISGLTVSNFQLTEQSDREALPTIENISLAPISDWEGSAIALVIDRSGSMKRTPMEDAKSAANSLVDMMQPLDRTAVISFNERAWVNQSFTSDQAALHNAIDGLSSGGATSLYDAIYLGIGESVSEIGVKAVIALTDGVDNQSRHNSQGIIDYANSSGVPVYTIGLGEVNEDVLQQIARETGGSYHHTPTSSELQQIYDELAQSIETQYLITYNTHNPNYDGALRTVNISVTYAGDSDSDNGTYMPDEPPRIVRTQETIDLSSASRSAGQDLTIAANITDNTHVTEAWLFYRISGSGLSYTQSAMTNTSGDIYEATIPSANVIAPGVDYYLTASDVALTISNPRNSPEVYPCQIAIAPNEKPTITHTPVTNSLPDAAVTITASVKDATDYVEEVVLFYRIPGYVLYDRVEMTNSSGSIYSGVIPGSVVTTAGVEYYIFARDNQEVGAYQGTDISPHLIQSGTKPDLAVSGIEFFNNTSPYRAKQISIKAVVRNNGPGVADAVVVEFVKEDNVTQQSQVIGSLSLGSLSPGETKEAIIKDLSTSELADCVVFAATTAAGQEEVNPGDNTKSQKVKISYVDWNYMIDAYSFENWALDWMEWIKIVVDFFQDWIGVTGKPLWMMIIPEAVQDIKIYWPIGHCTGMSSTAILYKESEDYKPEDLRGIATYAMDFNDEAAKLSIKQHHTENNSYFGCTYRNYLKESQPGGLPKVIRDTWETVKDSIEDEKPIVLVMRQVSAESGEFEGTGHAVVIYKILELGETKIAYIYDPEYPISEYETYVKNYGHIPQVTFTIPNDPQLSAFTPDPCYSYNFASAFYPVPVGSEELNNLLYSYFEDLYESIIEKSTQNNLCRLSFHSPVDVLITNQDGRKVGYLNSQIINEIPGAEVEIIEEMKVFYVPADLTYTVETTGTDSGTFDFNRIMPKPDGSLEVVSYEDVPTDVGAKTTLNINPAAPDYTMSLDNDGDGITDETRAPAYQKTLDTTSPDTITDLAASDSTPTAITLTWTAPGDDGDSGTASSYDIRYSTSIITEDNWNQADMCEGEPNPEIAGTLQEFAVSGLMPGSTYYFAIKAFDEELNSSALSNTASGTTPKSPPQAVDLSSSSLEVFRTNSLLISSNGADSEALESELSCEIEYKSPTGDWTAFENEAFAIDRWEVTFAPFLTAELGQYDFRVRYTNSSGLSSGWLEELDMVTVLNNPPAIDSSGDTFSLTEDISKDFDLTPYESDVENSGADLSWSIAPDSVDTGMFLAGIADKTLTITPLPDKFGRDDITLILTDKDGGQARKTDVTIIINPVSDDPPVIESFSPVAPNPAINEGNSLTFTVTAVDPDDDLLSYSWKLDGTEVSTTNSYTCFPTYEDSGLHQVLLVVSDGSLSASQAWTIAVNNVNRCPVPAEIGDRSVNENSLLTINLTASDPDNDSVIFSAETLPEGAAFIDNGNETAAFNWMPGYDNSGSYEVTFKVSDGACTKEERVTITVDEVNRPPVANAGFDVTVAKNTLVTLDGSGSSDLDGDTLTYTWSQTAGHEVILSDSTAVQPTFIPAEADTYTFELVINDGQENSDPARVTIMVEPDIILAVSVLQNPVLTKYLDLYVNSNLLLSSPPTMSLQTGSATSDSVALTEIALQTYKGDYELTGSGTSVITVYAVSAATGRDTTAARTFHAQLLTPAGGSMASPDRKVTLHVPPDALNQETYFTVFSSEEPHGSPAKSAGTEGPVPVGTAYRFGPEMPFNRWLILEFAYTEDEIGNLDETKLRIYQHNGVEWKPVESEVWPEKNIVRAEVTELGTYQLRYDPGYVLPQSFTLFQNYPNPFTQSTSIAYQLPASTRVSIRVYNLSGQLVKTLLEGEVRAGYHTVTWDGKDERDRTVANGVYLYQVVAGKNHLTKKMLLIK
ncbi:MAG: VWA domain-containing protein [bacterium]|nr:VWA domain-containing protein [bacterium]